MLTNNRIIVKERSGSKKRRCCAKLPRVSIKVYDRCKETCGEVGVGPCNNKTPLTEPPALVTVDPITGNQSSQGT